jgi:UDP-N-acetylglucosamine--N-acetylmuramyl-(pentapeptide) pyrophosphoryl-undecaprenol N-acetylglucosamine transferase
MARRYVSALFYAINGRGLGHLTRLLAVARAARELCSALDVVADFEIVTTSEASFICDDFPVYKLPSKTAVNDSFDRRSTSGQPQRDRYVQRAKLMVSNLVAAKAPDLLVLDTVPYGAFQELAFLRSYAKATAYIYRHLDQESASSDLVQRHLELFDRIVVPDDESRSDEYPASRAALRKLSFVGPIHGFDKSQAWDGPRVRAYFRVPPGKRLIYVSAGGGGDGRAWLETVIAAVAADDENFVLAGYGPLHRGERRYGHNVVPLTEPSVSRYFPGVDAAISAAGYNSYQELLAAGVPTLFFAQQKGLDRQDLRIREGVAAGWHGEIAEGAAVELLLAKLEDLLTGNDRQSLSCRLAERVDTRGALRAATALLGVCASFDATAIDRAALLEVAEARRGATAGSDAGFVDSFRAYRSWRAIAASPPEIAIEQDVAARTFWAFGPADGAALRVGRELVALRGALALGDDGFRAVLRALARDGRAPRGRSTERWLDDLRALVPHQRAIAELLASEPAARAHLLARLLGECLARADMGEEQDGDGAGDMVLDDEEPDETAAIEA